MRIFSLTKIDSGPEKQLEAEVCCTSKVTNNNTLGFILFVVFHTFFKSVAQCYDWCLPLYCLYPSAELVNAEARRGLSSAPI